MSNLSAFKPATENANKHTIRGLAQLDKSMQEDGWVAPITVAADGETLDGSARLERAFDVFDNEALVVEHDGKKPVVMVRTDIPNAKTNHAKRIAVRANRIAEIDLEWDAAQLFADMESGLDLSGLFDEDELAAVLGDLMPEPEPVDAPPQIDRAEELRKQWGVEVGQLWALGEHRLICGDCTDAAVVERVMGGEDFNLMVTDPPYGVNYEGGRNPANVPRKRLKGDDSGDLYKKFLPIWRNHRKKKGVLYIWFADRGGKPVYEAVEDSGFKIRALIIWNKLDAHYDNFMAQYMQKHEPCLYCVLDGSDWHGPTNEVTVWDIKQPNINEYHPTQKPLECMERPIRNNTKKTGLVVDPFLGSGTTLLACQNLNRRCRAVEIDPGYVAVALQRFQDATNITPELVGG